MPIKALDKRKLWKQIDQDMRIKDRQSLAQLRARLKEAREKRKRALRDAVKRCRDARQTIREKLRIVRSALKSIQREKLEAKLGCVTGIHEARAIRNEIEEAKKALGAEQHHRRSMRVITRSNKQREREAPRRPTAAERSSESDDEVRYNIPPELVPLFERVRKHIRGNERMTRTEAFLKYAEEHPEEYLESVDDKTDALIRELEEKERQAVAYDPAPFYRARR